MKELKVYRDAVALATSRDVESGEGIESHRAEPAVIEERGYQWNPVKELKAVMFVTLTPCLASSWNPVKELKVYRDDVKLPLVQIKWNPVKELKAMFRLCFVLLPHLLVESGEGIERFPLPVLPLFRPLISGIR